jgi:signal transduction histidine kinase
LVSDEVTWSDEVYNILGLEPGPFASKYDAFMDMVHVEDSEYVRKAIFDSLKGLCPYNITHRIILADGMEKVVRQIGRVLRTEGGMPVRMDGTIQDITEHWQREQELRHAKSRAEDADVAKAQFLSTVSHELRTPLNAIIGFGTLIADEVLGEIKIAAYRDYAEDIRSSGEGLLKLVQNILHITSYQLGSLKSNPQVFSVQEFLDTTKTLVSNRASEKNISIETSVADDMGELYLDPLLMQQILVHLIENAIKFSREGETVKVDLFLKGNEIVIDVIDHGVGLEDSDIVFDLFVQENMDLNRVYGGVGLGLTIVKNLVELQGGWVQVESKVGQGSCFSVRFSKSEITAQPDVKIGHMA